MLKRAHRLVNPLDFRRVVRRGVRVSGRLMTIHALARDAEPNKHSQVEYRAGFVVSKAVGPAVTRNKVKRRLRAIVANAEINQAADVIVRAAPASAGASFDDLQTELVRLLAKASS